MATSFNAYYGVSIGPSNIVVIDSDGNVTAASWFRGSYKSSDGTSGLTATKTFYTAATWLGLVSVLNTVVIKDGIITSWTQS
jgi:hypothetical protein